MSRTIVVLPTYNEIDNLEAMVTTLVNLPELDLSVLVVDDNSPDGTGRAADILVVRYPGRVFVLHKEKKSGLGPAYIAGFKRALELGADNIIQMDADFSHDPKYIPEMLKQAANADLVIASRYIRGGSVDELWGFYRKALSWLANRVYTMIILGLPVMDATSGYRLWKADTLKKLDLDNIKSNGYVFQMEMAYATHRKGLKIVEIPIHFFERKRGISKMGSNIVWEAAMRVLKLRLLY